MHDSTEQPAGDDAALLRLLQEQPRNGAAALYDRYGAMVFRSALRIVGDRGVAEEITQDVFVRCWRAAASYRSQQGSLSTWLLTIAHNRAIDELRSRRGRARSREQSWDEAAFPLSTQENASELRILRADVQAALAELPPAQREVIELLYYGGLTRQEAAERLHAPLGTVHTRARLAMRKLRDALTQWLDDEPSAVGSERS